jgi:hypothetical protein
MRPKVVITILLVGLAGFAGILFLKHLAAPSQPAQPAIAIQEITPAAPPVSPIADESQKITPAAPPVSPVAGKAAAVNPATTLPQVTTVPQIAAATNAIAADHEAYVQAHVEKLQELQANDDARSLQAILSELTNSDITIRAAAIEATTQFGSRDAIPALKNLAANTLDPDEKQKLLDAADFLALPSLTELREQDPQVKIHGTTPPYTSTQP